jgi:hypothetical protein
VVGAQHFGGTVFEELIAEFGDGCGNTEQILSGDGAQADDEFGVDDFDLRVEEFAAVGCFLGERGAVARRTAAEDIADVEVFAAELTGGDDLIQQLSGGTDEWFACFVFFLTGGFANEHDAGGDAADTEDGLFAATGELRTTLTRRDGVAETAHRRFAVGCRVELSGNGQGDLLQLSGYAYS